MSQVRVFLPCANGISDSMEPQWVSIRHYGEESVSWYDYSMDWRKRWQIAFRLSYESDLSLVDSYSVIGRAFSETSSSRGDINVLFPTGIKMTPLSRRVMREIDISLQNIGFFHISETQCRDRNYQMCNDRKFFCFVSVNVEQLRGMTWVRVWSYLPARQCECICICVKGDFSVFFSFHKNNLCLQSNYIIYFRRETHLKFYNNEMQICKFVDGTDLREFRFWDGPLGWGPPQEPWAPLGEDGTVLVQSQALLLNGLLLQLRGDVFRAHLVVDAVLAQVAVDSYKR